MSRGQLYCNPQVFRQLYDKQPEIHIDERSHSVFICSGCEYKYYTSIQTETKTSPNQAIIFKKENFGAKKITTNDIKTNIEMKFCTKCGHKLKKISESISPKKK
eukprot:761874_1